MISQRPEQASFQGHFPLIRDSHHSLRPFYCPGGVVQHKNKQLGHASSATNPPAWIANSNGGLARWGLNSQAAAPGITLPGTYPSASSRSGAEEDHGMAPAPRTPGRSLLGPVRRDQGLSTPAENAMAAYVAASQKFALHLGLPERDWSPAATPGPPSPCLLDSGGRLSSFAQPRPGTRRNPGRVPSHHDRRAAHLSRSVVQQDGLACPPCRHRDSMHLLGVALFHPLFSNSNNTANTSIIWTRHLA
jgi:hypothetical protein